MDTEIMVHISRSFAPWRGTPTWHYFPKLLVRDCSISIKSKGKILPFSLSISAKIQLFHLCFLSCWFHWILVSKCIVHTSFQNDNYSAFSWAAKAKTSAEFWIWKNLASFTTEHILLFSISSRFRVFYLFVIVSGLKTLIQGCMSQVCPLPLPTAGRKWQWVKSKRVIGHWCTEVERGGITHNPGYSH